MTEVSRSSPSVLHVLTQRPGLTGSGVTLDALVRHAAAAGWDQRVVVGLPHGDSARVGELPPDHVLPLFFEDGALDFPVAGMSDVMPYRSSVFSRMTDERLDAYRAEWRRHLARVLETFRPDVIHTHHVWLVSAMIKEIAPDVPVVTQCHATGLRQMELCPDLRDEVTHGCSRNDRFLVLHGEHEAALTAALDVPRERIHVVGAGYRDDLFHTRGRATTTEPRLVYVGKYSAAKGLPWLLDAFELLREFRPDLQLDVVGSGSGDEADALARRIAAMAPAVVSHGVLDQPRLAEVLRGGSICVLPSFYEGLPLVLVEALACGCRLVATDLTGVRGELAPHLGDAIEIVELPRMIGVDRPDARDLPQFTERLTTAIETALRRDSDEPRFEPAAEALRPFTWKAVFGRIERVWRELPG